MNGFYSQFNEMYGSYLSHKPWLLLLLVIWSIPWKGVALWRSALHKEKWWFIAILILNTFGILEIIYIFFFNNKRHASHKDHPQNNDRHPSKHIHIAHDHEQGDRESNV